MLGAYKLRLLTNNFIFFNDQTRMEIHVILIKNGGMYRLFHIKRVKFFRKR